MRVNDFLISCSCNVFSALFSCYVALSPHPLLLKLYLTPPGENTDFVLSTSRVFFRGDCWLIRAKEVEKKWHHVQSKFTRNIPANSLANPRIYMISFPTWLFTHLFKEAEYTWNYIILPKYFLLPLVVKLLWFFNNCLDAPGIFYRVP